MRTGRGRGLGLGQAVRILHTPRAQARRPVPQQPNVAVAWGFVCASVLVRGGGVRGGGGVRLRSVRKRFALQCMFVFVQHAHSQ